MTKKEYLYNAQGLAFAGKIIRPFEKVINVQAGMSLPLIGGYGSSRVEDFRFEGIVAFKRAHTQVSGSQAQDGSYTTLVSATVEGLNVLDMVTADRVVARLSSEHPPDGEEPRITPLGSQFENLRIAGCPVNVRLDIELFGRLNTFGSFKKQFEQNAEFRQAVRRRFLWEPEPDLPEFLRERYNWSQKGDLPESKGIVSCSLVREIETICPEIQRYGHVLVLPDFGTIFLAEFLLERKSRSLSMLRLELGSPVQGTMSASVVQGNGTTYP